MKILQPLNPVASMKSSLSSAVCAALAVSLTTVCRAYGVSFTGLGDLPGGKFQSDATAVSADGTVVVGRSVSDMGHEGFHWTTGDGFVTAIWGAVKSENVALVRYLGLTLPALLDTLLSGKDRLMALLNFKRKDLLTIEQSQNLMVVSPATQALSPLTARYWRVSAVRIPARSAKRSAGPAPPA